MLIKDKKVFITGGCSGMGRAVANLAIAGYNGILFAQAIADVLTDVLAFVLFKAMLGSELA